MPLLATQGVPLQERGLGGVDCLFPEQIRQTVQTGPISLRQSLVTLTSRLRKGLACNGGDQNSLKPPRQVWAGRGDHRRRDAEGRRDGNRITQRVSAQMLPLGRRPVRRGRDDVGYKRYPIATLELAEPAGDKRAVRIGYLVEIADLMWRASTASGEFEPAPSRLTGTRRGDRVRDPGRDRRPEAHRLGSLPSFRRFDTRSRRRRPAERYSQSPLRTAARRRPSPPRPICHP